jgi:hypothetical protein
LQTPTVVPRDFTERPQSYTANCSKKFSADAPNDEEVFAWLEKIEAGALAMDTAWLLPPADSAGDPSHQIIEHLKRLLYR